jgi:hypothetical protein
MRSLSAHLADLLSGHRRRGDGIKTVAELRHADTVASYQLGAASK